MHFYPEAYESIDLFKDGTFLYKETGTGINYIYSKGTWKKRKDTLILKGFIPKDDVPIKVNFILDSTHSIKDRVLDIVRNKKGEPIVGAMICINNNSTRCFPLGDCTGAFASIIRVKLAIGNHLNSKWAEAKGEKFNRVIIMVQSDLDLDSYEPFDKEFIISKNSMQLTLTKDQDDDCTNIPIDSLSEVKNKILFDKNTGTRFILDSTQTTIEARGKNGELIWRTNPWRDNKLKAFMFPVCPFITHFHFESNKTTNNVEAIMIGYNLSHFGYLDKQNGKFTFLGND